MHNPEANRVVGSYGALPVQPVPAVQQQHSEMSGSTEQTPHVESLTFTQIKNSDIQPIPAPCILMPTRSQFTPNGRLASSQTRSIGIQVDLQPTSDIKFM